MPPEAREIHRFDILLVGGFAQVESFGRIHVQHLCYGGQFRPGVRKPRQHRKLGGVHLLGVRRGRLLSGNPRVTASAPG